VSRCQDNRGTVRTYVRKNNKVIHYRQGQGNKSRKNGRYVRTEEKVKNHIKINARPGSRKKIVAKKTHRKGGQELQQFRKWGGDSLLSGYRREHPSGWPVDAIQKECRGKGGLITITERNGCGVRETKVGKKKKRAD